MAPESQIVKDSFPGILLLVLDLVASGKTCKEIGEVLHTEGVEHTSDRTIKRLKEDILDELGADSMTQAVAMAFRRGLIR